jgi:hypothetical protein
MIARAVVCSTINVEPYRKNGNDIPESLFVGRIRTLFVNYLGRYAGSALAVLWGGLAFVGFLPLMLVGLLVTNMSEDGAKASWTV